MALGLASLLVVGLAAHDGRAGDYRLGSEDHLKVRVVQWDTVAGTMNEWPAMSGEYTVGSDGNLALPFLDAVPAAGKSASAVADGVAAALQQKFGLNEKPGVSIELAEYRPFYVTGDVQSPGKYPFVPNLTVIKAVSIAGGGPRPNAYERIQRDLVEAQGKFDVLADERIRLLVKRARLKAEMSGSDTIDLPKGLKGNSKVEDILADEKAVMHARQKRLSIQLQGKNDTIKLLQQQIDAYEQKKVSENKQLDLAKKELSGLGKLAEKGLTLQPRVLSAKRTIVDMEGKVLDLDTATLQAKQDVSTAKQEAVDLRNSMDSQLADERQDVESKLTEATLKMQMQQALMSEASSYSTAANSRGDRPEADYTIIRAVDGKPKTIQASQDTAVLPGDVLKVERRLLPLDASVPVQ